MLRCHGCLLQNTIYLYNLVLMKVFVQYAITMHIDNVKDIFLLDNALVSQVINNI